MSSVLSMSLLKETGQPLALLIAMLFEVVELLWPWMLQIPKFWQLAACSQIVELNDSTTGAVEEEQPTISWFLTTSTFPGKTKPIGILVRVISLNRQSDDMLFEQLIESSMLLSSLNLSLSPISILCWLRYAEEACIRYPTFTVPFNHKPQNLLTPSRIYGLFTMKYRTRETT